MHHHAKLAHAMESHPHFVALRDVRDAAATTILQYAVAPQQFFVGLTQSLTLTITNGTTSPVSLDQNDADEIDVTFPVSPPLSEADGLVDAVTFSVPQPPPGWSVGPRTGSMWAIAPNGKQTINPGASVSVQFTGLAVNATVGNPVIKVQEFIGDGSGTYSLTVTKVPQALSVIAWPVPYTVGLNQNSIINWNSFGGVSVTVENLQYPPYSQTINVQGNPPYSDSLAVHLLPTDPGHSFGVVVNTGDGRHAQTSVPISQASPLITSFAPMTTPPNPLPAGQTVQLAWSTLFAAQAFLQRPNGTNAAVQPNPLRPLTVNPAAEVLQGAGGVFDSLPANATYTLQTTGFQTPASMSLAFPLARVALSYFKFTTNPSGGGTPQVVYAVANPAWPAVGLTGGGGSFSSVWVLTVYQPGGNNDVYYLGGDTTHPQVQYFAATASGKQWTLTWVTANLAALTLNGVAQDQIASGSQTVEPTVSTTYVLSGTGTNGQTITSSLDVTVT
jgi:hypothetical protein